MSFREDTNLLYSQIIGGVTTSKLMTTAAIMAGTEYLKYHNVIKARVMNDSRQNPTISAAI